MPRPWYETIFDERYPDLFGPLERDPEEEVSRMLELLPLPRGASLVDLGCGRGRHAIPLSLRGYRVTGVDTFCPCRTDGVGDVEDPRRFPSRFRTPHTGSQMVP